MSGKDYQESFQQMLDTSLSADLNETRYYDATPHLPTDIEFDEEGVGGDKSMKRQTSTSSSVSSAAAAEGQTGMPALALSPITPGSANPYPPLTSPLPAEDDTFRPLTPVTPSDGDRPSLSKCQRELKQSINKIEKVLNTTTTEQEGAHDHAEDAADAPVEMQLKRALKQNKKLLKQRKEILLLLGQTGKQFSTYEQESTRRRDKMQSDLDSSMDNNAALTNALETNNAAL